MQHATPSRILSVLLAAIALALTLSASAQATPQSDTDKPLRFDVVSIRPSGESSKMGMQVSSEGYQSMDTPIQQAVYMAYVPAPFFKHLDEVKGFPSWAATERYDLRARIAPEDAERWRRLNVNIMQTIPELQAALRAVLAERCNLQIHSEPTMIDAFALVRRPNAPLLTESTELPSTGTIMEMPDGAKAVFEKREGERIYTFYNTPMSVLATFIGLPSKLPVEDHTGLQGRYKLVLKAIDAPPSANGEESQERPPVPYDLKAIGMTVEKIKVKSTLWTIDHMDRPTPN